MIPVFTGISYIISGSYKPEPEFLKAIPVRVNRNRNFDSVPVCGRIIRFRSYPRQDSGTLNITRQNRSCRLSHLSSSSMLLPNQVPTPGSRDGTSARYNNSHLAIIPPIACILNCSMMDCTSKFAPLTLFPTAYFFCDSHGGGRNPPPSMENPLRSVWAQFFFYTVTYTYINSLNPRGQVSIFKTLEMRSAQSSDANLTNASKI